MNHGGPAFPFTPTDRSGQIADADPGMYLRDWFAGQALVGLIPICAGDTLSGKSFGEHVAECAYEIAEAMLKARAV